MTRECIHCRKSKPLTDYHKLKSGPDGRDTVCRICINAYRKSKYTSIPPAVYGIFLEETNECLYIGSSLQPYRRKTKHFTIYRNVDNLKENRSCIARLLTEGIYTKEQLGFRILEEVNPSEILHKEREWILKLQPKMNLMNPVLNKRD
jgi:hypothetical protein